MRIRARTTVAVLGLLAVLSSIGPPATATERLTYDVRVEGDVRTDVGEFAQVARLTFTDDRGWNLGGTIQFVPVGSDGDFHLVLASPGAVAAAAPTCSREYSCRVGDDVYINDDNFRNATPAWRDSARSLRDYQSYVILHEVGHWLGLDHTDGCTERGRAPVMMQQSISLQGCRANVWPVSNERASVARRYGEEILTGDRFPSPLGFATFEADWDGDGHDEPVRFDDGTWWLHAETDGDGDVRQLEYGRAGDIPVIGDWDGDGDDTLGVVRGNTFILRNDYSPPHDDLVLEYGRDDDLPVVGDWDGDGDDTIGVVRGNTFILRNRYSGDKGDMVLPYGDPEDLPVVGDWDGDGDDTIGVVRGNTFILRNRYSGDKNDLVLAYGYQVDSPVVGDFDHDGDDTIGVVRNATTWILRNAYSEPYGDIVFTWAPSS